MKQHFILAVLLLLGVVGSSFAGVIVHLTNNTDIALDGVQVIYKGSDNMEPLTSPLTAPLGSFKDEADLTGKVVVIPSLLFTSNLPLVRSAQERGAAAIISTLYYHYTPGMGRYNIDLSDVSQLTITVVEIAALESAAFLNFLQAGLIANVTLTPDEHENLWIATYSSSWMYIWQISLGLSSLGIMAWAIIKIVQFTQFYGRYQLSVAHVVLSIEVLAAFMRFLLAIDPFQIHGLVSADTHLGLIDNSLPLVHIASILIVLYWYEMMNNVSLEIHTFISRLRIPFYVLVALILAVHVIRVTLAAVLGFPEINLFNALWAMVISAAVAIFYGVVGIQLLARLRKLKQKKSVRRLTTTTIRILANGVLLVLLVGVTILFVLALPSLTPDTWVALWWLYPMMCVAHSYLSVSAFQVPDNKSTGTSGSRKSTHETNNPIN